MRGASGAALLALGFVSAVAPAALAQSEQDTIAQLRRQMEAMQRRLDALERRPAVASPTRRGREAERAASVAAVSAERRPGTIEQGTTAALPMAAAPIPAVGERPVTQGVLPNSFQIPGTGTSVRLYGIVAATLTRDFGARNRADVITAQGIPLGASVASRQQGDLRFDARRSRFGVETSTPTGWGPLRTLIEMDFAGTQSTGSLISQSNPSNYIPRLRHAFAELAGFTLGQTWTLLYDENSPERLDYGTYNALSDSRTAQLRYTHRWQNGISLAGSIENPYTDATFSTGVRYNDSDALVAPFPSGTGTLATQNKTPDVLARLRYDNTTYGNIALTGLLRPGLSINNRGDANPAARFERSATGWGFQLAGGLRVFERDRLYARVIYGDGIGRYLGSTANGQGIVSNALTAGVPFDQVRLNTVHVLALTGGFTHFWTPTVRSSAQYSWSQLYYPSYVRAFSNIGRSALNREVVQAHVNLVWSPVPAADVGVEYLYASRSLEVAQTDGLRGGMSHRMQFSGRFRF